MITNFKKITEEEFKAVDLPIIFENKLTDRSFAIVYKNIDFFKFGWQSTNVDPILIQLREDTFAIGVDLICSIVDTYAKKVLKNIKLNYFFFDFKLINDMLFVITELEVLKLNIVNFEIVENYLLSDFFESIEISKDNIIINTVDGNIINI